MADAEGQNNEAKARTARERGNALHKGGEHERAIAEYTRCIELSSSGAERAKAYANRAAAYMQLERLHDAIFDCECALEDTPEYLRAISRCAKCHEWIATTDANLSESEKEVHREKARALRQQEQSLSPDASISHSTDKHAGAVHAHNETQQSTDGTYKSSGDGNEEASEEQKRQAMQSLKELGNMVLNPFGMSTEDFEVKQDPKTGSYSIQSARKGGS